jgi:SNF2 family DNA or RNA helicase
MKWKPHEYQKRSIKWLTSRKHAALFQSPGLGKSSVTLAAYKDLRSKGEVHKALIVAPLRVCYGVWTSSPGGELHKWDQFRDLKVTLLHGNHKEDALEEDADIYTINFAGLRWLSEKGRFLSLFKRGVDLLVVDELSKLKHTKTQRFRTLKPHLPRFKRRWGLTGSPAANGLEDLFGEMMIVDGGASLGPYVTHYRAKYFVPDPRSFKGYGWMLRKGAEKEIYEAIAPVALSMKAEDHLDLPKLVEKDIFITLPPKARKIYDELEKDLITLVKDKVVTASSAGVASMKCRQVASGGLYTEGEDGKRITLHLHDEKAELLKDLIEELQGQPLLVGYQFKSELREIEKVVKQVYKKVNKLPALNGETKAKEGKEIIARWNAGDIPVLAGHPESVGHGLNLQDGHCSHVCFYSLPWSYDSYSQMYKRVYRQGNKAARVIVHRLLARKTLDETVAKALQGKKKVQNEVFKALKKKV